MKKVLCIVVLLMVNITITIGQGCCSGGAPLSSNLGIQSVENQQFQIQLAYNANVLKALVLENKRLEEDNRTRLTQSTLLRLGYGFGKKYSVSILSAYVWQSEEVRPNGLPNVYATANGIGDVVVLGQYQFLNQNNQVLTAGLGGKIPTGSTERKHEDGWLLNADLQPGTGSWDGIMAFFYKKDQVFKPNLSFTTYGTFRLSTQGERFGGLQTYKFGHEWQLFFGINDRWTTKQTIIDLSLLMRYRFTLQDELNSVIVLNTGGHWLYVVPAFTINLTPNLGLVWSGDIPIYRSLSGIQLTTSFRTQIALQYQFKSKKEIIEF